MNDTGPRKLHRPAGDTTGAIQRGSDQPEKSARPMEPNPYLAGEVIGDRYRLVRELGSGGMGVVWVAHSLVLGVDVALKLIRASSAGAGLATRMAREAHAAARLGHPALVRVFDFGWTSRGDPFLVMELVQGETVAAVLAREARVPAIRAVQMLLPIADGLRLAHDKNIIHRDIKPENIFLASDAFGRKQPKLLDFGIAKVGPAPADNRLTQVGVILGSPEYMSPEQACGDEVDERTDVWSLCVVLYEAITGTVPFRKSNYNALMQAIIHEVPAPTTQFGAGDAALWQVVERGLAKLRHERWTNVTELGEALALWLYGHGIKEDLSGNSIRAVWLDGEVSGLRADLPSTGQHPATDSGGANLVRHAQEHDRRTLQTTAGFAFSSGFRQRNVALAIALAVVAGAVVAALRVGLSSEPAALPRATPAFPAVAASTPPPAATATVPLQDLPRPNIAPRVANDEPSGAPPQPNTGATAGAVRPRAPKTTAPPPRPTARPTKPTHDFGF
jgi:eukaryotic-like serine/threonine-protein kinase